MKHYSTNKEIARIVRAFIKQGWCYRRGPCHGKLIAPNGRMIPVPCTPSDYRALMNFEKDLRRIACL